MNRTPRLKLDPWGIIVRELLARLMSAAEGEHISLAGLGTFCLHTRPRRRIVNPHTHKVMMVGPTLELRFRASAAVRKALREEEQRRARP